MSSSHDPERRRHPRVCLPFPASVEGVDEGGKPFRAETALDDLSAGGVYLRLAERVLPDAVLTVTARFSMVPSRGIVVRLTGRVLRVEPKPGGAFGVAVLAEGRQIL